MVANTSFTFPVRWTVEFIDYASQYIPFFPGCQLFPDDQEGSLYPMIKNFNSEVANDTVPNRMYGNNSPQIQRQVSTSDAFRLAILHVPNECLSDDVYAYNEGFDSIVGEVKQDGSLSTPQFNKTVKIYEDNIHQLNTRRNPKATSEKFFQYMVTPGYRFSQKNIMQTLQVIQKRYAGPVKKFPFNEEADQLAKKIAELFVTEHIDLNRRQISIDEYVLTELWKGWNSAAESKKYFNMFQGHDGYDWATVSFHLKTIFKPKMFMRLEQLSKVGQGISAWGKDAQILFSMVGRVLNHCLYSMLKATTIYDNKITLDQLFQKVKDLNKTVPDVALNGVTDMTEFDKNQNRFSQRIEYYIWLKMGFNSDMLDHYYSLRLNYAIRADVARAKVEAAKTSGEPLTLANNTIVAAAISNYLLRGIGPFYMVMKGDDLWKRQCDLKLNRAALYEIQKYVDFDLKVSIEDCVEYCGNIVTPTGMFPNLQRKLYKILSHSFRDYTHFAEYQISLRDFMNLCHSLDKGELIAVNMELLGAKYAQVENLIDVIQSFAHISKDQFVESFRYRKVDYGLPKSLGDNKYEIVY